MTSGPHVAWLAAGSALAVAGFGWGALNIVELLAHEEKTVTEVLEAADVSLIDIENDTGRVVVTATDTADDTGEITITAHVSEGLRAVEYSHRMVGDRLEIRGDCPLFGSMWCSVDYRIEVPADVALDIDVDDGRVEVVDVVGALTIGSDNGRIEIRNARGPLAAMSDNGSIDATGIRSPTVTAESDNGSIEIVMVTPPDSVRARADNGRIEVVLPDTTDPYAVNADSDNGSVRNDVRTDPSGRRTVDATSDNGSVTIRYP